MSGLKLQIYPEKKLRKKTEEVRVFSEGLKSIVRGMEKIMRENNGIGLASTQAGLDISLIIIDIGDGLKCLCNPKIVKKSSRKTKMEEGCLSLPGVTVCVERPEEILVEAKDVSGKEGKETYSGLIAKVVQHEMDHLNGVLLLDYLNPVSKFFASRKILSQGKR